MITIFFCKYLATKRPHLGYLQGHVLLHYLKHSLAHFFYQAITRVIAVRLGPKV